MLDAAFKALYQMSTPPMRRILWKSIGLALILIVVVAIGLERVLSWLAGSGQAYLDAWLGSGFDPAINIVALIIRILVFLGIVAGAIFLMPAVTALVASVFVDDVAEEIERTQYPADKIGTALPLSRALTEGGKTALLSILIYLIALPFVFVFGAGLIAFYIASAYLLGREYFEMAAMRFRSVEEAKAMRKEYAATVFSAGLLIAGFVLIPIVNLATPVFGMALMVHLHKRLSGPRPELIEPRRPPMPVA